MKIYDQKNDKVISTLTLYLTPEEAEELAWVAKDLSENPSKHHHHVEADDSSTEITVAVYTENNFDQFDSKSKEIITSG